MIRRDIQFPGQEPQWLVISQPEHARLSRVLAESAAWAFPTQISYEPAKKLLAEILYAIDCHDDGWIDWETYPKLDPEHKRPYSFLELPRDEVLPIWGKSIEAAQQIGPLAAWMVAGHFETLLKKSDDAGTADCLLWLKETAERRQQWLAAWQSQNQEEDDTLALLADEALAWLRIYEEISLWRCCVAPSAGEVREDWPEDYQVTHDGWHSDTLSAVKSTYELFSGVNAYRININPWQARNPPLILQVRGHLVPQKKHRSTYTYNKYGEEFIARWLLMPDNDEWMSARG